MPNLAVFSTSVEVFLHGKRAVVRLLGLLHVRGGVSQFSTIDVVNIRVFSTSVEVFPRDLSKLERGFGLLHVRGGVSLPPSQQSIHR